LKHRIANYATPALRIYVGWLTVLLIAAPSANGLRPWRPHVKEAASYAAARAGAVSFGVRTRRGLRGVGVERVVPSASVIKPMLLVAYCAGRVCATARFGRVSARCSAR
jgi:hypothetical protein